MKLTGSFVNSLLFAEVIALFVYVTEGQSSFEDDRCKCICPKINKSNGTKNDRTVYIANVDAVKCKCEYVVNTSTANPAELCPLCECKYESRNTTTIKVVVIFIICIVSLLFVYMLFLLCLDPLIARRPAHYAEHMNEEDDPTISRVTPMEGPARPRARQKSIINRVTDEQKKWKGTVQEQRKHIYDRHSMLN